MTTVRDNLPGLPFAKSLVPISLDEAYKMGLLVFPRQIVFRQIRPQRVYRRRFGVKNVKNDLLRVLLPNIIHPVRKHYLQYPFLSMEHDGEDMGVSKLWPGMERTACISYHCSDLQDKHAEAVIVLISTCKYIVRIPIVCEPVKPKLKAPLSVDFQQVPLNGVPQSQRACLTNCGKKAGVWNASYRGPDNIVCRPSSVFISPGEREVISIDLKPSRDGKISGFVELSCADAGELLSIPLYGQVIASKLYFCQIPVNTARSMEERPGDRRNPTQGRDKVRENQLPDKQVKLLDFGCVHYGTCHTRNLHLVNRGVINLNFRLHLQPEEQQQLRTPSVGENQQSLSDRSSEWTVEQSQEFPGSENQQEQIVPAELCFSAVPTSGLVKANASQNLTISFSPQLLAPEKGFSTTYTAPVVRQYLVTLVLQCSAPKTTPLPESADTTLQLRATAVHLQCSISPTTLDYHCVLPLERRVLSAQIFNSGYQLPVKIRVCQIAQYTAETREMLVTSGQTRNFSIVCRPTQLGNLHRTMRLEVFCLDTLIDITGKIERSWRKLDLLRLKLIAHCTSSSRSVESGIMRDLDYLMDRGLRESFTLGTSQCMAPMIGHDCRNIVKQPRADQAPDLSFSSLPAKPSLVAEKEKQRCDREVLLHRAITAASVVTRRVVDKRRTPQKYNNYLGKIRSRRHQEQFRNLQCVAKNKQFFHTCKKLGIVAEDRSTVSERREWKT